MSYEQLFLYSLFITELIEIPLIFSIIKYGYKIKNTKTIFVSLLASLLTLPYFWFILPAYITDRTTYLIIGETIIIIIEAIIYWYLLKISFKQALIISIIANTASASLGTLFI
jgi:hypothetical protein